MNDAQRAGQLPGPHRDPFDRMLIGQAVVHGLALVSIDAVFDGYGVGRPWQPLRHARQPIYVVFDLR